MSIELHINDRSVMAERSNSTLFEIAEERLGVSIPNSCRKRGKCRECLVEVTEGAGLLSEKTASESHLRDRFRLSCQTRIAADRGTVRCHTMRRGAMKIERHAMNLPLSPSRMNPDPAVTRRGRAIYLDDVQIDETDGPLYGIAMDLGTTTVVLRLMDLETGEVVADSSFENPQRFAGSEIMSRIQYDTEHEGKLLQQALAGYVRHAIEGFSVDPKSIYEMVVVGNSTMRDLFFRLNVYSIGQSPYRSITELELLEGKRTSTSVTEKANRLLIRMNPRARVYGLPILSGHVGADASACMLAVNLADEDRLVAIMDIGTNTELIVGNRKKILAASCPAGPAFEGGAVSCGMPGLPGAIEKVRISGNEEPVCDVIGNVPAEGICGSGLVDVLSELLRTGRMNSLGRFDGEEHKVDLASNEEGVVSVTEADINELAQAKGANVAGLRVVFRNYGITFDDLDVFYLAGGFGRNLDIGSSKRIGLIPNIPDSKILQVGNAALEGASIALLSRSKRAELERLIPRVTHCRLETDPHFFDHFVEGCQFKPVDSSALMQTS